MAVPNRRPAAREENRHDDVENPGRPQKYLAQNGRKLTVIVLVWCLASSPELLSCSTRPDPTRGRRARGRRVHHHRSAGEQGSGLRGLQPPGSRLRRAERGRRRDADAYNSWIDGLAGGAEGPACAGHPRARLSCQAERLPRRCRPAGQRGDAAARRRQAGVEQRVGPSRRRHSSWVPADQVAQRLKEAGITKAHGFALTSPTTTRPAPRSPTDRRSTSTP